jgi:hypothetical protein
MVIMHLSFAQTERLASDALSSKDTFHVRTSEIFQLVEYLQKALSGEVSGNPLSACFLGKEDVSGYIQEIYAGTDMAHDSLKVKGITEFYLLISSQAKAYFEQYRGRLTDIELHDVKTRTGSVESMKVMVLSMNLVLKDGEKIGRRINVIEVNGRYVILNLED